MPYCTKQDMINRFGRTELEQLTDHEGIGKIDVVVLDRAIAAADAEINARVKKQYTVPLSPVPEIINLKACDITRYFLYDDRVTDQVEARYKEAIAFLKDVRDGKEELGDVNVTPEAPSGRMTVNSSSSAYDWDTY